MTAPDCSPAAERNKQPILEVLQSIVPATGRALEIASGTGQHVHWFATHMPAWTWQPTEVQRGALYNIEVRIAEAGLDNALEPITLDVRTLPWFAPDDAAAKGAAFDLIFCANMLHIAPWEACVALMQGSASHLTPSGVLVTYGPYFESDTPTAQSNADFDQSLRAHDAHWGIRWRHDVEAEAGWAGLQLKARHVMPSNNLLLVWGRSAA
jgi:hypothetical protein